MHLYHTEIHFSRILSMQKIFLGEGHQQTAAVPVSKYVIQNHLPLPVVLIS